MLAVHLENGCVEVRDIPAPARPAGYALIRMLCAGICNTDLELKRGYYGFAGTPGHEFVGEVVQAGRSELIGRRVVGEINLSCGHCDWCRRDMGRHCPHRDVLGIVRHPGAFSELLTLPESNLHIVPDEIPTERAVFTEPLAAACEILDQAALPCAATIAVLGDGKLGLLIGFVLNAHGYRVHLYGRHPEKLRLAAAAGIRTIAVNEAPDNAWPVGEYQWVVEATGSSQGLKQAVEIVRPRGVVILKSTVHGTVGFDTAPVIVNELTLVGSRCGRFEPALHLLEHDLIPVESMISVRRPLSEAPEAFEQAARKGVLKVLLENHGRPSR